MKLNKINSISLLILTVIITTAEAGPLFRFNGDRLDSVPIKETKGAFHHDCSDVISNGLREGAFIFLTKMSEANNIAKPKKTLCSIVEHKPSNWGVQTVDVNYYLNNTERTSCIYNDYCENTRSMGFFSHNNEVYGTLLVTYESGKALKMSCINVTKGKIVGSDSCASLLK